MNEQAPILFEEVQRAPTLMWVITAGVAAVLLAVAVALLLMAIRGRLGKPAGYGIGGLMLLGAVGLVLLSASVNLSTIVNTEGLYVRLSPFQWSHQPISLRGVTRIYVRTYNPVGEYGGWGIRRGARGDAYNMRGDRGVQLDYATERSMLIGSQHPEKLKAALDELPGATP